MDEEFFFYSRKCNIIYHIFHVEKHLSLIILMFGQKKT